jgi:hypothetical protein
VSPTPACKKPPNASRAELSVSDSARLWFLADFPVLWDKTGLWTDYIHPEAANHRDPQMTDSQAVVGRHTGLVWQTAYRLLGNSERIACWYKPKDSKSYRVVYGDLSVKDVAPADLPLAAGP